MIVYGDPSRRVPLIMLAECLRERLMSTSEALARSNTSSLCGVSICGDPTHHGNTNVAWQHIDRLRALLIRAGQAEQAVLDEHSIAIDPGLSELISAFGRATRAAAEAFVAALAHTANMQKVESSLRHMALYLELVACSPNVRVTGKMPEGFAFYTLYPEQYIASTRLWIADHTSSSDRHVIVVGVRSIGTTLGAVVATTLEESGWAVQSLSVRPTGHPFAREATFPGDEPVRASLGIVVDEGPGLSGSSMAAGGDLLVRAGVPRNGISFFPGHANDPGRVGSDVVRGWWASTPRYPAVRDVVRIGEQTLIDALSTGVSALLDGDPVEQVEDFGGGLWRRVLYPSQSSWPVAAAPFERVKYRFTMNSGRRVLARFGGLAGAWDQVATTAERDAAILDRRAAARWCMAPLGIVHGFIVLPWVDGRPLTRNDLTPAVVTHLGRYIVATTGEPLQLEEEIEAFDRLRAMLIANAREAAGETLAADAAGLADRARGVAPLRHPRQFGDGRMAPHEWVRVNTRAGELLKMDGTGHAEDHTMVGAQPVIWDLAGAIVEWECDAALSHALHGAYQVAGGDPVEPVRLAFYEAAYAAFRAGQCHFCADITADPDERSQLLTAFERYRFKLNTVLDTFCGRTHD